MCGIAGIIGPNEPSEIVRMTDEVPYRGPDDSGHLWARADSGELFVDDSTKQTPATFKADVALGHRRLSILDLSSHGHQPMANDSKTLWITFNGEVYNYIEIREELTKRGCSFLTGTDTEVVLKAYETWGTDCFRRFNGMWAMAIWDSRNQELVLSRDRFGVKPLYYSQAGARFLFASEIKQIRAVQKSQPGLNLPVLERFLADGVKDFDDQTFFEGILKFPPGCFMVIRYLKEGIDLKPEAYWRLGEGYSFSNSNDPFEHFFWLLKDAVRLRLRSDVKIGCLLSGGLDSSAIASMMAQIAEYGQADLEQFTFLSFCCHEKKYDEQKYIDEIEKYHGLNVHRVFLEPKTAMNLLTKVVHHQEEPFGGFSVVAQYLMFRAANQQGLKVVLSGQGADEAFCGYKKYYIYYLLDLFRKRAPLTLCRELFFYLINNNVAALRLREAKRYLPSKWRRRFDSVPRILTRPRVADARLLDAEKSPTVRDVQVEDIRRSSLPALLHYEDRNSMAFSTEVRNPFLDYRLVDFALGLSDEMKLRNGWSKYVLRKSLANILPPKIARRRDKMGFETPENTWLRSHLRQDMKEIISESLLEKNGIIHRNSFAALYESFLNGRENVWHMDISRLLMAEMWLRCSLNGQTL